MNGSSLDVAFRIALRNLDSYRVELVPQLTRHQRTLVAVKLAELAKALLVDDETPKAGDVAITASHRHPEAP
jgi:hypothetical protein